MRVRSMPLLCRPGPLLNINLPDHRSWRQPSNLPENLTRQGKVNLDVSRLYVLKSVFTPEHGRLSEAVYLPRPQRDAGIAQICHHLYRKVIDYKLPIGE